VKIRKKDISNIILLILSLVVIYFSYRLLHPFIRPVLGSFIVALLVYPIYTWLNKKIKNKFISSMIIVVLFILIIAVPFGYVVNIAVRETYSSYIEIKKVVLGQEFFGECTDGPFCEVVERINDYFQQTETKYYMQQLGELLNKYVLEYGSSFVLKVPAALLDLFVFLFFLFYLLKDGDKIVNSIKSLLPLDAKRQDELINKTKKSIYAVLYGQFLTSFIQGFAGGLGFFILGLSSPVFWGIIMAFFSILPVGTTIIWLPASIYLIVSGLATGNTILLVKGIILLAYGIIVISTIDNLLRPKLVGDKLRAHPLLILIGLLGGIYVFGVLGIFIGPLILTLLVAILEMYKGVKSAV
jgi:predicted PurR-regulated permease PerM